LIALFRSADPPDETFPEFTRRLDDADVHSLLADFSSLPREGATDCYLDWGDQQPFTLRTTQ
jgi:hypothetical protein